MNEIGPALVAVVAGVLCLAIVAVIVGQKAQTSAVLTGGGQALANVITAATAPVTGNSSSFGSSSSNIGGAAG